MKTKSMIMLTFLLFVINNLSDAQIKFGVKAGLNSSTVATDKNGADLSAKTGLNLGGFVCFHLSESFAIQPELYYAEKGAKAKGEYFNTYYVGNYPNQTSVIESGTLDGSAKLTYLDLQALGSYQLDIGGSPFRPLFFAGPSFAIRLTAREEQSGEVTAHSIPSNSKYSYTRQINKSRDDKDIVKSADLGIVLGGGIRYRVEKAGSVSLDLRYNLGVTNFNKETSADAPKDFNRVFSILIGYEF